MTRRHLLLAAAAVGSLHAAASAWWAFGGRALLDTVGPWAVELARTRPLEAGVVLALVAAAKLVAGVVPVLVHDSRLRGRAWRPLCLAGGCLLAGYGGLNAGVAWAVLGGLIVPSEGYDTAAMLGHAALWDPLFLVWGVLLLLGLRRPVVPAPAQLTAASRGSTR